MRGVVETISLRFAIPILEGLERNPNGLRNKDLDVDNDWTKTNTLKSLLKSKLILHVEKPDGTKIYKISSKGRIALKYVGKLKELDHRSP